VSAAGTGGERRCLAVGYDRSDAVRAAGKNASTAGLRDRPAASAHLAGDLPLSARRAELGRAFIDEPARGENSMRDLELARILDGTRSAR
jgi:hypothetical protein